MIEGTRNFISRDDVEALMSMGEAWRMAVNDRVGQVRPHHEELKCTPGSCE